MFGYIQYCFTTSPNTAQRIFSVICTDHMCTTASMKCARYSNIMLASKENLFWILWIFITCTLFTSYLSLYLW